MLQLCVHFSVCFIVVRYLIVLAPCGNFGNDFSFFGTFVLCVLFLCLPCTSSPCYLFALCVPFLSFVFCASCPFICPVRFLAFYLPYKLFPLLFVLCPFIFPRVFLVLLFALFVIFFVFTLYVLCPFICSVCPFLAFTLCSLLFSLYLHCIFFVLLFALCLLFLAYPLLFCPVCQRTEHSS